MICTVTLFIQKHLKSLPCLGALMHSTSTFSKSFGPEVLVKIAPKGAAIKIDMTHNVKNVLPKIFKIFKNLFKKSKNK